jgi:hypothetical protein
MKARARYQNQATCGTRVFETVRATNFMELPGLILMQLIKAYLQLPPSIQDNWHINGDQQKVREERLCEWCINSCIDMFTGTNLCSLST